MGVPARSQHTGDTRGTRDDGGKEEQPKLQLQKHGSQRSRQNEELSFDTIKSTVQDKNKSNRSQQNILFTRRMPHTSGPNLQSKLKYNKKIRRTKRMGFRKVPGARS
jgi:uncharacterized Zn-finger protein